MAEPMIVVRSIDRALCPELQEARDLGLAAPMVVFYLPSVQWVQMALPLEIRYIPVGRTVLKVEVSAHVVQRAQLEGHSHRASVMRTLAVVILKVGVVTHVKHEGLWERLVQRIFLAVEEKLAESNLVMLKPVLVSVMDVGIAAVWYQLADLPGQLE